MNENIFQNLILFFKKPSLKQKVTFFRLMAVTQRAGLGIRDSLISIKESEKHPWMREILNWIIDIINQWYPLSDGMQEYRYFFSSSEIALIKSSETMWNMPEVLENISSELESFLQLRSKIKWAMTYPAVVLIFSIIAIIILLDKVVPVIVWLFPSVDKLPEITKFVISLSELIKTKGYFFLMWFIWFVFSFLYLYKYNIEFKKLIDEILLKIPMIWQLVRNYNHYRFSKLLSDYYNAWVSPTIAFNEISMILGNYHYKNKIKDISEDLKMWLGITESIAWSWLFDQVLIQVLQIWEKTWNIWEVLSSMSKYYKTELETQIEWLTKLIEPFLMAFVAIIIWTIAAAVFLPMADLISTIWS